MSSKTGFTKYLIKNNLEICEFDMVYRNNNSSVVAQ